MISHSFSSNLALMYSDKLNEAFINIKYYQLRRPEYFCQQIRSTIFHMRLNPLKTNKQDDKYGYER